MIDFDKYSLKIDGERILIRSASMHYFRIPDINMWKDRLSKIKAGGYNTVDLYFNWAYHSQKPNSYDFTGIKDIRSLLDITTELGLYVIARPGPYINAEISGGGLPFWLFNKPDVILRNREDGDFKYSKAYMHYVKEWYSRIIPILNEYQNIVAFQIENEYSSNEAEPDYIQELYDMAREMGVIVPIFHNDAYGACLYSDIVNIYAFDSYPTINLNYDWKENNCQFEFLDNIENNFRDCLPSSPFFAAELQAGWFDKWGGQGWDSIRKTFGRDHINIVSKTVLSQGLTIFNHYMGCGGTSWNNIASSEVYTSYDFASPIDETGIPQDNYYQVKEINYFLQAFNLASTDIIEEQEINNIQEGAFTKFRQDNLNNCKWLFVRNLNNINTEIKVNKDFNVNLKPYDMKILPQDLKLKGCKIDFSTFSIFSKINNHNQEVVLLLIDDDSELILSDFDEQNIPSGFNTEQVGGKLYLKLSDTNNNNLLKTSFSKAGQTTEFIFLNQKTADKTWILGNKILIGADFIQNNPYQAVFSQHTEVKVLDLDKNNNWQTTNLEIKKDIKTPELKNWSMFSCSPEIDPAYDYSSWNFVNDNLNCINNNIFDEFIWYKGKFSGAMKQIIINAKHCYSVYINGFQIFHHNSFHIEQEELDEEITFEVDQHILNKNHENDITILVQNLGFDKGFSNSPNLPRGILKFNCIPARDIEWKIRGKLTPELEEWDFVPEEELENASKNSYLMRIGTNFDVNFPENTYNPMVLNFNDTPFDKAMIYLNGNLIGHYWKSMGPQKKFYLIDGFLKKNNLLSLVIWDNDKEYQKIEDYEKLRNNVNINIEIIKTYSTFNVAEFF
jgi:beta-galactosidase